MQLKNRLSVRIRKEDIFEILGFIRKDEEIRRQLAGLVSDPDDRVAYQALWVCSHLDPDEQRQLSGKQNEWMDEAMVCKHPGKRRLLLTLLDRQPLGGSLRTDFLDYCLNRMNASQEASGVKSLCMKLAYKLCRPVPELLNELRAILELMETGLLPPSVRTVRKHVLSAIGREKSVPGK